MSPPETGRKGRCNLEVKSSYDRLQTFQLIALGWKERHPELTVAVYGMDKVLAQLPDVSKRVDKRLADEDVEFCLTEKRGDDDVITRDKHQLLEFTKGRIRDRNAARAKILETPDITVEVRFAKRVPRGMTELELLTFRGLVFAKDTVNAELARRLQEVEELERKEDEEERKAQEKSKIHVASDNGCITEEVPA